MQALGQLFVEQLFQASPKRTGKFASSWFYRVFDEPTAEGENIGVVIDNKADYSPYVLFPTRAHDIYPKGNYPLHFYWEKMGKEVWFWHVHHPGTKGNPVHEEVFNKLQPTIEQLTAAMGAETWAQIVTATGGI